MRAGRPLYTLAQVGGVGGGDVMVPAKEPRSCFPRKHGGSDESSLLAGQIHSSQKCVGGYESLGSAKHDSPEARKRGSS